MSRRAAVHFIGFRGEEYWSAARIWGRPGFIHRRWDLRALRDIDTEVDVVIFAQGTDAEPPSGKSGDDLKEEFL
ncbi:hypothetical protein V5F34_00750 [Xanthobacter autotrophicus]|uniref:hypothetical protein n=1 Tax=Xanthobacter autotrophicus TaxID=280 RepID=UPI003729524C